MKRLTRRSAVGEGLPVKHLNLRHEDATSEDSLTEILEALAAYEDAGLEPGEITCCINLLKGKCWACSNARAYRIGNSNLKTCHYRMKGCVAATAQPECEHWTLDVGCLRKAEPQKETKGCSGECDFCPDADGCEQCGSV